MVEGLTSSQVRLAIQTMGCRLGILQGFVGEPGALGLVVAAAPGDAADVGVVDHTFVLEEGIPLDHLVSVATQLVAQEVQAA